ncbi:TPRN protein, partial [Xiphorhynchus elegans]|nr:TPRN protein [Xiphorhynchus elegans]
MRGCRRDPPPAAPGPTHPALQRRSGNTITVRPLRAPGGTPGGGTQGTAGGTAGTPNGPSPTEGGGAPPKKRYPTAAQIEVIGGYLALPRSCLAKNDPHRKKV